MNHVSLTSLGIINRPNIPRSVGDSDNDLKYLGSHLLVSVNFLFVSRLLLVSIVIKIVRLHLSILVHGQTYEVQEC